MLRVFLLRVCTVHSLRIGVLVDHTHHQSSALTRSARAASGSERAMDFYNCSLHILFGQSFRKKVTV